MRSTSSPPSVSRRVGRSGLQVVTGIINPFDRATVKPNVHLAYADHAVKAARARPPLRVWIAKNGCISVTVLTIIG
ncbi:MAG: hypothetical protein LLG00_14110 [Planctomycetaceae bacterium]|nr:hypothetical protein [Planctomycetaceae bacterium]